MWFDNDPTGTVQTIGPLYGESGPLIIIAEDKMWIDGVDEKTSILDRRKSNQADINSWAYGLCYCEWSSSS